MKTALPSRAGAITVRSVAAATVLGRGDAVVVDLRSPAEFALDHVPGAHNLPLFDDVERALVGTLYRKSSPDAAFDEGRGIARRKIAVLAGGIARVAGLDLDLSVLEERVDEMTRRGIGELARAVECELTGEPPPGPVVLHCWRGGLRSRSVAALFAGLGLERVVQLHGGYKAYRAEVARELDAWRPPRIHVLYGLTGVGKTLVLREIERARPGWTIDLEALAGHRSSLLGGVGLEPRTQKAFESGLAARIRAGASAPLVVEGESRKVGDVILPPALWRAMGSGVALEVTAPPERRFVVLCGDYLADESSRRELLARLPSVEARMRRAEGAPSLAGLLEEGRVEELVGILLERYYDPLYRHGGRGRRYAASFDASRPELAARRIVEWIESAPA
jgi:tRNA 2-selenouridine synthase